MSAGNAGESGLSDQAEDFLRIVQEGRSFSGRERHCLFVNLQNGQFADVSAVSGFNLPDDGRGAALVDWDRDGDPDVWVSNRNGPQVRLFINQRPSRPHFLALRLQGTKSNRDAIGARVQLFVRQRDSRTGLKPVLQHVADARVQLFARHAESRTGLKPVLQDSISDRPIQKTVRAGDGFLSQSSKQLLFGLGDALSVDRIVVRWPSGQTQTFRVPAVDREYLIVEGQNQLQPIAPRHQPVDLATRDVALPADDPTVQTLCFSMIHLPVRDYLDQNGQRASVLSHDARLVLVNLWATWCQPCVDELEEITRRRQDLRQRGIDIVALSVSEMAAEPNGQSTDVDADIRLLHKIRFPFRSGRADEAMVEKLQLLSDTIFELKTPLPVPTSFLLDRRGRVVALYKGPVSVDRLLADAGKLRARTTDEWRMATLPFPGRWVMPPRQRHLFQLVQQLADRDYFAECKMYVENNEAMLTSHPGWAELARKIQAGLQNGSAR